MDGRHRDAELSRPLLSAGSDAPENGHAEENGEAEHTNDESACAPAGVARLQRSRSSETSQQRVSAVAEEGAEANGSQADLKDGAEDLLRDFSSDASVGEGEELEGIDEEEVYEMKELSKWLSTAARACSPTLCLCWGSAPAHLPALAPCSPIHLTDAPLCAVNSCGAAARRDSVHRGGGRGMSSGAAPAPSAPARPLLPRPLLRSCTHCFVPRPALRRSSWAKWRWRTASFSR